jgi:hypothetical protein
MKHFIAKTPGRAMLYVDLISSPAAASISQRPYLLGLLKEMARGAKIVGIRPAIVVDMGRTIGNCHIVKTTSSDSIIYARRLHTEVYSRFVKTSKVTPTQYLSARFKKDPAGNYELIDAWPGMPYPPLPGSEDETAESKPFWEEHAFVFNGDTIQVRTLTKVCPY